MRAAETIAVAMRSLGATRGRIPGRSSPSPAKDGQEARCKRKLVLRAGAAAISPDRPHRQRWPGAGRLSVLC
jgi:hypothetical protein